MPGPRTLHFDQPGAIMAEVDRLLAGYTRVGNWSLGQMCNHLAWAMRGSIEGRGSFGAPWIVRRTIGPIAFHLIRSGRWRPKRVNLPEALAPKSGLDDRAEAEALRATIQYYLAHSEPLGEHPLFGRLTREQWDAFHCFHAARHLGHAIPREST
jgi:hypothetical protein